jgi:hypothetical protein
MPKSTPACTKKARNSIDSLAALFRQSSVISIPHPP